MSEDSTQESVGPLASIVSVNRSLSERTAPELAFFMHVTRKTCQETENLKEIGLIEKCMFKLLGLALCKWGCLA